MKRYLLFVGPDYYASGGMEDFMGDFDGIETAKGFINPAVDYLDDVSGWWEGLPAPKPILERTPTDFMEIRDDHWAHIYDTEGRVFVFKTYDVCLQNIQTC